MIDRAALAGIAIGAGLLLLFEQVFSVSPVIALVFVGGLLFVCGLVVFWDVREQHERMVERNARGEVETNR